MALIRYFYFLVTIFSLATGILTDGWAVPSLSQEEVAALIEKQLEELNNPQNFFGDTGFPAAHEQDSRMRSPKPGQPGEVVKIESRFSLGRENGGMLQASVQFANGVPFLAVFCRDNDWYITLSYATSTTFDEWEPSEFPEITEIGTLSVDDGFSYKIRLTDRLYPKISFDKGTNTLKLSFGKEAIDQDNLTVAAISQPRNQDDSFRMKLRNAQADVEFYDPDTDEILWVICADEPNRPIAARQYPEFDVLLSYQGAALVLKGDELDYSYVRKVAEITKDGGLGNSFAGTAVAADSGISVFADFNPATAAEMSKAVAQQLFNGQSTIRDGLFLAWLYLGQGFALEAMEIFDQLLEKTPDLKIMPFWRSIQGFAKLLGFRYQQAQDLLGFFRGEPEINFWRDIASLSQKVYLETVKLQDLLLYTATLQGMPQKLQDQLRSKILEIGIVGEDKQLLRSYGRKLNEPDSTSTVRHWHDVAIAIANLNYDRPNSGEILRALARREPYSKASVLAMFEYLRFMRALNKIEAEDELKQLDRLRYIWRGDLLEYRICRYLAKRYLEEQRFTEVLPLLRKTIKYFTQESHADQLPEKMQQALLAYFNRKPLPVLEMLSIFQEYMSIAPDDERGDAIMIKATNTLANLELYQEAIGLLKEYMKEKARHGDQQQERRNLIYYRMAVASILDKKPEDCLNYLSQVQSDDLQMIDDAAILRAEAYLLLKDMDKAVQSLGKTPNQLYHKASIYFGAKKWAEAITVYLEICNDLTDVPDPIQEGAVINLALCYAISEDQQSLSDLHSRFRDFMEKQKGQPIFEFLTQTEARVSLTDLESLQQVTSFVDKIKSVFSDAPQSS